MAKITPPEVTQEFHFYTMKKFPKVLDNKIHVVHFLEATTDLLVLIDQLGNMFAPVKYDMQGNVDKIKKFYTYKEDTCLLALMLDEKSRGRDEGAEGVLWLNRSLLFFELVFEEIIKSLQRKEIDASIKTILTTAYNGSVKKYHNWVTQKLFSMTKCKSGSGGDYIPTAYWFPLLRFLDIPTEADASQSNLDSQSPQADSDSVDTQQAREEELILNISPSLPQMLKLLDPSQNMEEFEKRLIELHYCLKIIRCRIDTFFQENNMFVEKK